MNYSNSFGKFVDVCIGIALVSMSAALAVISVLATSLLIKELWLVTFH